jgi:glycosyltransferase involved in cell wall biosynthesis
VSLTVVIPVYNDASNLRACLAALNQSAEPAFECIVADDGSTHDSVAVAGELAARVLESKTRSGPAHARNVGASAATSDILFFIDSDVCVHADTLSRVTMAFEEDSTLDALIGSSDDDPGSDDFVSQYKNLMHCFVHQTARRDACTFRSGCGAIRKSLFQEHSGFSEDYRRPAIEDIELGFRLQEAGRKLIFDPTLTVKHLKRWTFWSLLRTDVKDRTLTRWLSCRLRSLGIDRSRRISSVHGIPGSGIPPGEPRRGALLFFVMSRYWLEAASEQRSLTEVMAVTTLAALLCLLASAYGAISLIPLIVLCWALPFIRHGYTYPRGWVGTAARTLFGVFLAGNLALVLKHLPDHWLVNSFLLVLIALFLAAKRGKLFTIAAIPFHVLFHIYNGYSFLIGLALYSWRSYSCRNLAEKKQAVEPLPK